MRSTVSVITFVISAPAISTVESSIIRALNIPKWNTAKLTNVDSGIGIDATEQSKYRLLMVNFWCYAETKTKYRKDFL